MNIVDLVTKLGSFGLIIYIAVKLVPHVVGFLDEQRKALQTISAGVHETKNEIQASELRVTAHATNRVHNPLNEKIDAVHTEILEEVRGHQAETARQIAGVREDVLNRYFSIRELIVWLSNRMGADPDDGSIPPPPQSERGDGLGEEQTLDVQRPSASPTTGKMSTRPTSNGRRRSNVPVS